MTPRARFTGRQAIAERYRTEFAAFPGRQLRPVRWVEEGDTVVVECQFTGMQTAPLPMPDGAQLAPTGQQVSVPMLTVGRVVDGKLVECRLYYDRLPFRMPAGVVASAD